MNRRVHRTLVNWLLCEAEAKRGKNNETKYVNRRIINLNTKQYVILGLFFSRRWKTLDAAQLACPLRRITHPRVYRRVSAARRRIARTHIRRTCVCAMEMVCVYLANGV